MIDEDLIEDIDRMDYGELLTLWRFHPMNGQYFLGEVGKYYKEVMYRKRDELEPGMAVRISKEVGWENL